MSWQLKWMAENQGIIKAANSSTHHWTHQVMQHRESKYRLHLFKEQPTSAFVKLVLSRRTLRLDFFRQGSQFCVWNHMFTISTQCYMYVPTFNLFCYHLQDLFNTSLLNHLCNPVKDVWAVSTTELSINKTIAWTTANFHCKNTSVQPTIEYLHISLMQAGDSRLAHGLQSNVSLSSVCSGTSIAPWTFAPFSEDWITLSCRSVVMIRYTLCE